MEIGKYYKLTIVPWRHPYLKKSKLLPYPEYKSEFTGKLYEIKEQIMRFNDVYYELIHLFNEPSRSFDAYMPDIISYEIIDKPVNLLVPERINAGRDLNETHIGKSMRLLVSPEAHPYMKFVKVFPSKDYKCEFTGTFMKIYDDKWHYGELLEFSDVDFALRKKHKPKDRWQIRRRDILDYFILE